MSRLTDRLRAALFDWWFIHNCTADGYVIAAPGDEQWEIQTTDHRRWFKKHLHLYCTPEQAEGLAEQIARASLERQLRTRRGTEAGR